MELRNATRQVQYAPRHWQRPLAIVASLSVIAFATASHAVTLFQVDPNPSGTSLNIDNLKNSTTSAGTVVSTDDVSILVTGASDFASGNATIKPTKSGSLTDLIFTPASATAFDGFSFRGQDNLAGQTIDVIVTDQANVSETFSFTVSNANQDFDRFGIIAALAGETIKSIEIQNSGGFKEAKQFEFDVVQPNAGVPEPATWAVMLLGFGGIGAALRSTRRTAALT